MKRFIITTSVFVSILFIIIFVVSRDYHFSDTKSGYMDALIDKHKFAEKCLSPKIIFVGGSNLAFGIDSKKIENTIGLPVVNLGLYSSLSLPFMINEVKFIAKSSDIVIFSPEYYLETEGDYRLQKLASRNFPLANNFFEQNYYKEIKQNFINNISQLFTSSKQDTSIYSRDAFNENGDVVSHLNCSPSFSSKLNGSKRIMIYRHYEGIELLNAFSAYAKANNIKVYFLYPNYPELEFSLSKDTIKKYSYDIDNELHIRVLNKPEDFVFDNSLFFDSIYHLNKEGRNQRTQKLIELIKEESKAWK